METPLLDATEKAVAAATHLDKDGLDAGQIEAVRALARKIDTWDVIVQWAIEDASDGEGRGRPAVPQNDNVSIASYMKGMASLGLTPEARNTIPRKADAPAPKKRGGTLASVSNIPRPSGT